MTSINTNNVNAPALNSSVQAVNPTITGTGPEQTSPALTHLAEGILNDRPLEITSAASLRLFKWKKLLEKLEGLTPQSHASSDSINLDPKIRLANLSIEGKTPLNLRRKMLSLISIEREFLKTAALEARTGMKLSVCVEKMEKCGIKASNDGFKWQFEISLKMPEAPEGFAFFWPLLLHLGTHSQTTKLDAKRFRLGFNWGDKLKPMRSYLEESSHHSHEEVCRLSEGYLAMLTFKENTGIHKTHYQLHRQRLESLLEECSLLSDQELLSLFSQCTPALYRLLIIEIKDLLHTCSQSGENEFPKEIYEKKTLWHDFAKGDYLQSQNALYGSLMEKLPSKMEFRKNFLYQGANFKHARGLEKHISGSQEFLKIDPYSEEREASKLVHEKPKPKDKKNKTEISQPSAVSQTSSVEESPPSSPALSCFQNPPPFPYHPRVMNWFKMEKGEDPQLERQRMLHAFDSRVDQLIRDKTYTYQKDEKWGQAYYLVAQFNFEDGTIIRGIVNYVTFVTSDGKEVCCYRCLSEKKDEEFVYQTIEELFKTVNQDKEPSQIDLDSLLHHANPDKGGSDEKGASERNHETARIEFDPKLRIIKIPDKNNGLVISLFPLPIGPAQSFETLK